MEIRKQCSKCKNRKSLDCFGSNQSKPDGKDIYCKECRLEAGQKHYRKNQVIIVENKRSYRANNAEKVSAGKHIYYENNRAAIKVRNRTQYEKTLIARLLYRAEKRSEERGLAFNLTTEDIKVPDVCPVLGLKLVLSVGLASDDSLSLDRIVPSLGYVSGNVAVISGRANRLKSDGTVGEHRLIAEWMNTFHPPRLVETNQAAGLLELDMVCKARKRAKSKNIPFGITKRDINVPDVCPVLGIPLRRGRSRLWDGSPTLDRFEPEKGYVQGNIVVMSHRANRIKNDGTAEEHLRIADWMDEQMRRLETNYEEPAA